MLTKKKTTKEQSLKINKAINKIFGITKLLGKQGDIYAPSVARPPHLEELIEKVLVPGGWTWSYYQKTGEFRKQITVTPETIEKLARLFNDYEVSRRDQS